MKNGQTQSDCLFFSFMRLLACLGILKMGKYVLDLVHKMNYN